MTLLCRRSMQFVSTRFEVGDRCNHQASNSVKKLESITPEGSDRCPIPLGACQLEN